jgi:hypothetical protein
LFILCERLFKILSCEEVYKSIKDLFIYRGDKPVRSIALIGVLRGKWSVLVLITIVLVAGF